MKTGISILITFFALTHTYGQDTSYRQTEIIYGRKDGMALTMHHLQPKVMNGKAIVKVNSGNWVSSPSRIPVLIKSALVYLKHGYSVFIVTHGSQPRYALPDQVKDIKRAVRFIRHNAKTYGIDPLHIGITGTSSGGNLSLLVSTADDVRDTLERDPVDRLSSRVQAAVIYFPPTDFLNWGETGGAFYKNEKLITLAKVGGAFDFREYDEKLVLYSPVSDTTERIKIYKQVSPVYAVTPDDPPVLLFHGDKDRIVPFQQSQLLIQRLNESKVPSQLVVKKDRGHGWAADDAETKQVLSWFDKYLK